MARSIQAFLFILIATKAVSSNETFKGNQMYQSTKQTKYADDATDSSSFDEKENGISNGPKLCIFRYNKKKEMVCVCKAKRKSDQITLAEILKYMGKTYMFCTSLRFEHFKFETLENGSFDGFKQLSQIFLFNCSVMEIGRDAFKSNSLLTQSNITIKIEMNPIRHIKPGTFDVGKSWKQLSLCQNQNLGTENIQTVFNDLRNKTVDRLEIKTCGIFLRELDKSFFEPLRYSRITKLNMIGNSYGIVTSDAFEPLGAFLQTLVLWNFMDVQRDTFGVFHKLRGLNIGGLTVTRSSYARHLHLHNMTELRSLSINMEGSRVQAFDMSGLEHLQLMQLTNCGYEFGAHINQVIRLLNTTKSLRLIDLSDNSLCKYTDRDLCQIFAGRVSLYNLLLKDNYFTNLPTCMFKGLYNLHYLNLQSNLLQVIQKDLFEDLHQLTKLDLSQNAITFIDSSNLEMMTPFQGFMKLDIRQNNFDCNCQLKSLRNWLTMKIMQKGYKFKYKHEKCSFPIYKQTEYIHNFTMTWLECNTINVVQVSTITGSLVLIVTIVTLLLLKHFWKDIQYRKMIILARKHEQDVNIDGLLIEHDAFVSYHSEKQLWVENDLCNELENGLDIKFKLIYDDRIMPGGSLFTSLGYAIHTSRKILFVVSRGWVKDGMNQFEVDMALSKLLDDYRDMIIVLLMEHIPKDEMPDKVKMIIKHNNCLRWSNNEKKQAKFWRDLKLELGKHHFEIPIQDVSY
ncbi:unnamed protein product [Owenia fusiformis]|uniref:TIR domain-containing protein n=2 Tax=Owenia fusiformis TaxID=6347 RepID=A0A8S4Q0U3_OWEFU|nr:unnamed protein product [Owenia fusiformis]